MSRQSVITAMLSFLCFVLLMFFSGYVSQKWQNHKQAQCFKFEDRQQRWACLRRV